KAGGRAGKHSRLRGASLIIPLAPRLNQRASHSCPGAAAPTLRVVQRWTASRLVPPLPGVVNLLSGTFSAMGGTYDRYADRALRRAAFESNARHLLHPASVLEVLRAPRWPRWVVDQSQQ